MTSIFNLSIADIILEDSVLLFSANTSFNSAKILICESILEIILAKFSSCLLLLAILLDRISSFALCKLEITEFTLTFISP